MTSGERALLQRCLDYLGPAEEMVSVPYTRQGTKAPNEAMLLADDIRAALAAAGPDVPGENGCASPRDTVVADLLITLHKISTMQPAEIGRSGFIHGPALLLSNCQRAARDALRRAKKNGGLSVRGEANPLSSCGEKP